MPENPTYAETAIELSNKEPKTFFTEELQLSIRGKTCVCVFFVETTSILSCIYYALFLQIWRITPNVSCGHKNVERHDFPHSFK